MNTNTGEVFEVPMSQGAVPMKEATAAKVGFRELTETEANLVAQCRQTGSRIEALLALVNDGTVDVDKRWTAIAKTHFQEGLMATVRAIAKPAFF